MSPSSHHLPPQPRVSESTWNKNSITTPTPGSDSNIFRFDSLHFDSLRFELQQGPVSNALQKQCVESSRWTKKKGNPRGEDPRWRGSSMMIWLDGPQMGRREVRGDACGGGGRVMFEGRYGWRRKRRKRVWSFLKILYSRLKRYYNRGLFFVRQVRAFSGESGSPSAAPGMI